MVRIKNLHDDAVKMLKTGNDVSYERNQSKNNLIIRGMFDRLISGKVDICVHQEEKRMITINRSSRSKGVQVTYFWIKDGEYIPQTHTICLDKSSLIREVVSGRYELLAF